MIRPTLDLKWHDQGTTEEMNAFQVSGIVKKVETKQGPKSDYHVLYIETDENEEVGIVLLKEPPEIGQRINVTGRLASHQGYPRLKVESVSVYGEGQ